MQPTETESVQRLGKDLRLAAKTLTPLEARYLVDSYYQIQENRKASGNQVIALAKAEEPHSVLSWFADQNATLENQIRAALDKWAGDQEVGRWAMSIVGIGPVITAGFLANLDITKAPSVGHFWRFCGLDPTSKWEKGCKRPWNASMKRLAWLAGESFVKVSNNENDVYGKYFKTRKVYEVANNDAGKYSEQAAAIGLVRKFKDGVDTKLWYTGQLPAGATAQVLEIPDLAGRSKKIKQLAEECGGKGQPMLAPAHIHARSKRYAVKLFLAHLHHVMYKHHFKVDPPLPYPIAILGHADYIPPPNLAV